MFPLLLLLLALSSCASRTSCTLAFTSPSSPSSSTIGPHPSGRSIRTDEPHRRRRHRSGALRVAGAVTDMPKPFAAAHHHPRGGADDAIDPTAPSRASSFQRRMRGLVRRGNGGDNNVAPGGDGVGGPPPNLRNVRTLEEYKEALDESGMANKMVVVRFFATWCKACKAIQPSYYRLASHYPHVTFLEVPVTNDNANLHQGLGVPSLPYGHVYHPISGLVEEMKMSRRHFHELARAVRWYDDGMCGMDDIVPPPPPARDDD